MNAIVLMSLAASALAAPPQAPEVSACAAHYRPEYLKSRGLTREKWTELCGQGFRPEKILEMPASAALGPPNAPGLASGAGKVQAVTEQVSKIVAGGDPGPLYEGKSKGESAAIFRPPKPADPKEHGEKPEPKIVYKPSAPTSKYVSERPPEPAAKRPASCWSAQEDLQAEASVRSSYLLVERAVVCLGGEGAIGRSLTAVLDMTGLRRYHSGGQIGVANRGLNRFFEQQMNEENFGEQVYQFLSAVWKRAKDSGMPPRASLADSASGALPAGWIWSEAMRASRDDPNLAMRLIGFCGHDNVNQTKVYRPLSAAARQDEFQKTKAELENSIEGLKNKLRASNVEVSFPIDAQWLWRMGEHRPELLADLSELEGAQSRLDGLSPEQFNYRVWNPCPSVPNHLYLAKSLDADADISDDLKARLSRLQAPGQNPERLNAKYYHVYGGALIACEMIRKGAPPAFALWFTRNLAWYYRTARMNETAESYAKMRNHMETTYRGYLASLKRGEAALPKEEFARAVLSEYDEKDRFGWRLDMMDAYELLERWGYGGELFGVRVPITESRVFFFRRRSKPEEWSQTRFEAAKRRLETFLIDWEWTVAQHDAGARFAAKVCRDEGSSSRRASAAIPPRAPMK